MFHRQPIIKYQRNEIDLNTLLFENWFCHKNQKSNSNLFASRFDLYITFLYLQSSLSTFCILLCVVILNFIYRHILSVYYCLDFRHWKLFGYKFLIELLKKLNQDSCWL